MKLRNEIKLILASASPRRMDLLRQVGISFQCQPSRIDETIYPNELAQEYVKRMAFSKAQFVCDQFDIQNAFFVGADTIVVLDKRIFGKPKDEQDAAHMISELSGNTHQVLTSVSLFSKHENHIETITQCTDVTFRKLTSQQIHNYVRYGESMDKAGAYGIQGMAAAMITGINGCYFNVMGLPLAKTVELLLKHQVLGSWP